MLITKSYLAKWKNNSFLSAMLWAAMGLVLIIFQDNVSYSLCYLLGTILLILGVPQLFLFIMEEEKHIFSTFSLVSGISISFLGIWALTLPEMAHNEIPNTIAFVTLIHGLKDVALSRRIQVLDKSMGSIAMVISLVTIVCSLLILFLPLEETSIVAICSGVLLICDGVSDFWMWSILTKRSDEHRGI